MHEVKEITKRKHGKATEHSFFAKINPSACLDTGNHDIKEVMSELILQVEKDIANENKSLM